MSADALPGAAPLLSVSGLSVDYRRGRSTRRVINDVSFSIRSGETLGLVGESGSGKSTIGKAILGLVPVAGGVITFNGENVTSPSRRRRRELTRDIQVIYQDPYGSLNPSLTIGATLAEPLLAERLNAKSADARARIAEALRLVGLPAEAAERYPSDFSGGQRQRIAIARAIIVRPRLIVCDEAVSALDLSIQAQVLNLLQDLSSSLGVSYLFISHDLAVVEHVSDRVAVLRSGAIVESGDAPRVLESPQHPYTRLLRDAAPIPDPIEQRRRHMRNRQATASAADVGSVD